MNTIKVADLILGNKGENKTIKWFNDNTFSKDKLGFYKNPYNVMDMCNSNNIMELKTRNIYHNQFYDIMIGYNKIKAAESNKNKDILYTMLFLCKDGLYGWKYNPKQYTVRGGGRNDRGLDERCDCAFIPHKFLYLITTEINSIS